jgi:putative transposase
MSIGSHYVYDLHYHIVFPTKGRINHLSETISEIIVDKALSFADKYRISIDKLGMDKNHIHLLCSIPPSMSIGQLVRIFKSLTAQAVFEKRPELAKLWNHQFWSDGYYAATTASGATMDAVALYVANQGKE